MVKKRKGYLAKLRFKYRLSILNENTLEETWHARLSRLSVFVWAGLLFLLTFGVFTLLIYYTPIKRYLPGFEDAGVRELVTMETVRIDSLQMVVDAQKEYISVLRSVMSGELEMDSVTSVDSLAIVQRERLNLEKTEFEKAFCAEVEEEEQFNLSQVNVTNITPQYVFYRPVRGVLLNSFAPNLGQYGVSIMTSAEEVVMSVLSGRVVLVDFSMDHKWVVVVQHEDNYLSVYRGMNRLQVKMGDAVQSGEVLGRMGDTSENAHVQLEFELWKKGVPVNPEDVIVY